MLKKGDIVMIYKDPYGRTMPEGEAKLIKRLAKHKFAQAYWKVKFMKNGLEADRFIVPDKKKKEVI